MSRLICRPIEVVCNPKGYPGKLYIHHAFTQVEEVLDKWMDTGCWWDNESEKMFYRICCNKGSIYEVFQDLESKQWFLYKAYD